MLIYILVRSKSDDTEVAFREVVRLDLDRILSRLRSRHAKSTRKTAGKRPLIEQLHDAIHTRSIKATKTLEESRHRVQDLQSLFTRLKSITNPNVEIIEVEVCTLAPPIKPFFAHYFPKLLSATNQSQNSMYAPSHTIASQHTQIEHWKSPEDMEFGELPRSAHKERRNEIHKTVEISQP